MPKSKNTTRKTTRKSRRSKAATTETIGNSGVLPKSSAAAPRSSFKAAIYSLLLGIGVIGGWSLWQTQTCEAAFLNLADAHKGPLQNVRTMPNLGRSHLNRGQSYRYPSPYPTSGSHSPVWTKPGMYTVSQPDVQLVHALEHGNIVIYYDQLAKDDLSTLESWAGLYTGQWSGVVVAPRPGLGGEIVLTAWRKILRQKTFDTASAAMFVDTYRGRGPEHPVR